jgi:hypothetical protein
MEYTEEIIQQAKIVLVIIGQYQRKVTMELNHVILRETIGNICNALANIEAGSPEKHGAKPDARPMSLAFYEKWKHNPIQANLRKIGIYEHRLPMKVIRHHLIGRSNLDETAIIDFIRNEVKCAWITFEEDKRLKDLGLNAHVPENGDRYITAIINLHNEGKPQHYLGRAKRKQRDA